MTKLRTLITKHLLCHGLSFPLSQKVTNISLVPLSLLRERLSTQCGPCVRCRRQNRSTIGGGGSTIPSPGCHQNSPSRGQNYMIPYLSLYIVGKLAPNRTPLQWGVHIAYLQPVGVYVEPPPKDARDVNPGKLLPSAPPPFVPFFNRDYHLYEWIFSS